MILSSVSLDHFRSYTKRRFEFTPQTTLIVGPNAVGKTNIIESICMMAIGKSFRAGSDREVIAWGSEMANVECRMLNDEKLQLIITQGEVGGRKAPLKKYLVNGVPRRQIDFVGNLRAVLFWPQDLELVTDSPSLRRRYLDSVLVQVDREYRRNLYSYEKGLRQRNKLLDLINEGTASRSQLLFWNQLLIKAGGYITDKRAEYIEYVNASSPFPELESPNSGNGFGYQLEYDKSVISESRLEQYKDEEVAAKATLVGPHRDDFMIEKAIRDMKYVTRKTERHDISPITSHVSLAAYGSRGEQRMAVLWLKLAELSFIALVCGERPVLLLDDIFSELDPEHRDLIFGLIASQQTIMTTADSGVIPEKVRRSAAVIEL